MINSAARLKEVITANTSEIFDRIKWFEGTVHLHFKISELIQMISHRL